MDINNQHILDESPGPLSQCSFILSGDDGDDRIPDGDYNVEVVDGMMFLCVLCV